MLFKLDAEQIVGRAKAALEPITPNQYTYSQNNRDLRNITPPSFLFDNKGRRLAGRFSPRDITDGFPSPLIWCFMLPMVGLSFVSALIFMVVAFFGFWIPLTSWGAAYATKLATSGEIGMSILTATGSVIFGMWKINFYAWLPSLTVFYLAYLVIAEVEPTRLAYKTMWYPFAVISAGVILVPLLGPLLGAFIVAATPFFIYYGYIAGMDLARHKALRESTEEAKGMTGLEDAGTHEEARAHQAADSLKQKLPDGRPAPLWIFGADKGWVRNQTGYMLSADEGAPVGLTLGGDTSTHFFIFGNPGTGKTLTFLQPLAKFWADNNIGGGLYLDAKDGALPKKLFEAGAIDTLIDPVKDKSTRINLLAGMQPQFFAKTLADENKKDGDSSIWNDQAEAYINAAMSLIVFAKEKSNTRVDVSVAGVNKFCVDKDFRLGVLDWLKAKHSGDIANDQALLTSYIKWAVAYENLANDTRSSLAFTIDAWLGSMMSNPVVANAAGTSDGIDVPDFVCRGKRVGIVLGEAQGIGGRVAISVLKAAVLDRLKRRGDKWRETHGEKDVLIMVDEAAPVIGWTDAEAAAQVRSLGGHLVYACQNFSQVANAMSGTLEHGAKEFLGVFGSIGTLKCDLETYQYVASRMPVAWRLHRDNTSIEAVPLDKGVEKIRADGIQDRRQGAIGDRLSSISTMFAEARKSLSLSPTSLGERKDRMREGASETYQLRQMHVIEANDLSAQLSGKFIFAGNIQRAGIDRVVIADVRPGAATKASDESMKSLSFISRSRQLTKSTPEFNPEAQTTMERKRERENA